MVRRGAPVLPVGLPGCGPPILARDRPICSMARGTEAFRREETCALGCTDRGWMPGGDLKSAGGLGPRTFRTGGRARRAGLPAGPAAGPAAPSRPVAGAAASRAGNGPWGPTPPTPAGPPGAAARGSVETGRDLRAAPAQGGSGRRGGEQPRHSGGEREPEPGQGDADSPPDIPFC